MPFPTLFLKGEYRFDTHNARGILYQNATAMVQTKGAEIRWHYHDDIEYYYTSRAAGEASGVDGTMIHPSLPMHGRVSLTYRY